MKHLLWPSLQPLLPPSRTTNVKAVMAVAVVVTATVVDVAMAVAPVGVKAAARHVLPKAVVKVVKATAPKVAEKVALRAAALKAGVAHAVVAAAGVAIVIKGVIAKAVPSANVLTATTSPKTSKARNRYKSIPTTNSVPSAHPVVIATNAVTVATVARARVVVASAPRTWNAAASPVQTLRVMHP